MMTIRQRILYFYLGTALLIYVAAFFPEHEEVIEWSKIVVDVVKAFAVGFVVVYIPYWMWIKFVKKETT